MFLHLVATIAAGLGAAGVMLALHRLTGRRLPRWLIPVAAGLAMIGYAVWSEYSWPDRVVAGLPEGVVEVMRIEERMLWRPWTYLAPQTTRLMAADAGGAATHPDRPSLRLIDLYLFARWQPTRRMPVLLDCAGPARADVTGAALADPEAADWRPLAPDDPLLRVVCGGSR